MFDNFRKDAKIRLSKKELTYSQLGEAAGVAESTIKCFMCGANNSRRIAEKIADALGCELIYNSGTYEIKDKEET